MIRVELHQLVAATALIATGGAFAQGGDARRGAEQAAMCIGCHGIEGYRASFPQVYRVPHIAGQGAAYLQAALQGYRDGTRRHPTMRAVARSLSDRDIADLAKFYEGQP